MTSKPPPTRKRLQPENTPNRTKRFRMGLSPPPSPPSLHIFSPGSFGTLLGTLEARPQFQPDSLLSEKTRRFGRCDEDMCSTTFMSTAGVGIVIIWGSNDPFFCTGRASPDAPSWENQEVGTCSKWVCVWFPKTRREHLHWALPHKEVAAGAQKKWWTHPKSSIQETHWQEKEEMNWWRMVVLALFFNIVLL